MHNGQVGGFERFRKYADFALPDDLFQTRQGATDSEALFLTAVKYGLDHDPIQALQQAVHELENLSRERGTTPHMRLSAVIADGKRLFAVRYSSDHIAPSVYYRWCDVMKGWAVVSEPLDPAQNGWKALAPGQVLELSEDTVKIHTFEPANSAVQV